MFKFFFYPQFVFSTYCILAITMFRNLLPLITIVNKIDFDYEFFVVIFAVKVCTADAQTISVHRKYIAKAPRLIEMHSLLSTDA